MSGSSSVTDADALHAITTWPVDHAAGALIRGAAIDRGETDGAAAERVGDTGRVFRLASVTKPLVARATLVAIEEGAIDLDTPAGPPGASVRHLLAHTAGLAFDSSEVIAPPGTRRIYSNSGFAALADAIEQHTDIPFAQYLHEAVFEPLGMVSSRLDGPAGSGAESTVDDLVRFAAELLRPSLISAELAREASEVAFPGLDGILPGYGRRSPNDWGLGVEIRGHKSPHWTGTLNSPRTFGHFGQSGTFLWVDPEVDAATVALTDRPFGPWTTPLWPDLSDGIVRQVTGVSRDDTPVDA